MAGFIIDWKGPTPVTTTKGDNTDGSDRQAKADTPHPRPYSPAATKDTLSAIRALTRAFTTAVEDTKGTGSTRLDVVESSMPILAHREARLRFGGDGLHWAPVNFGDPFGVDAVAVCQGKTGLWFGPNFSDSHPEPAPVVDCTCGFYAMPLGQPPYTSNRHLVRLLVELSGDVIECELMYRAGHQRVVECQIPPCTYCARPATVIQAIDGWMRTAACNRSHVEPDEDAVYVTVNDLAGLLPVPVTHRGPR